MPGAVFVARLARLEDAGLTPVKWLGAPPEVMEGTLNFIKRRYGSVEDYLIHCGFDERWMDELRSVMEAVPQEQVVR